MTKKPRRYDTYSKSTLRPISVMSIDAIEPVPSAYKSNDVLDEEYLTEERPSSVKREVLKTFVPDIEEDDLDERLYSHTYCPNGKHKSGGAPIFIISITIFQISYFIYMYKFQYPNPVTDWNSWNYQFYNNLFIFTASKACEKNEYWRFFTYCFIHSGWQHLFGNMVMQLVIGIPLEYIHGSCRVALIYVLGVVTGSLTALVVTPNTLLVGASGGDFCLIAAVLANCALNCDSMHPAASIMRCICMGGYLAIETWATVKRFDTAEGDSISWAAHMGGAITGLFFGLVVLRNREKKGFERCFSVIGCLAYITYIGTVLMVWFLIVQDNDIHDASDISTDDVVQAFMIVAHSDPELSTEMTIN